MTVPGYYRWNIDEVIDLVYVLQSEAGPGISGRVPEVSIRRFRDLNNTLLDGFFWNGAGAFVVGATWMPLTEHDPVNNPGFYRYSFAQPGLQQSYVIQYRNLTDPNIEVTEFHMVELNTSTLTSGGLRQIDLTIESTMPAPLPGVRVDVLTPLGLYLFSVLTDNNGETAFSLDDGTYHLRMFKEGFSFVTPYILVVDADEVVTVQGTGIVITPPSSPNLCRVYGIIRDASGVPIPGACVEAYAATPQVASGFQAAERIASVTTDPNGYFEIELVRLMQVNFRVGDANLDVLRVVPDLATQDLATWS